MSAMNELYSAASRESEIDALVDQLIAKILSGDASQRDLIEYDELVASRTRLMRQGTSRSTTFQAPRRKYA